MVCRNHPNLKHWYQQIKFVGAHRFNELTGNDKQVVPEKIRFPHFKATYLNINIIKTFSAPKTSDLFLKAVEQSEFCFLIYLYNYLLSLRCWCCVPSPATQVLCVSLQQWAPSTFWGAYGFQGRAPNPAGVATAAPCTVTACGDFSFFK